MFKSLSVVVLLAFASSSLAETVTTPSASPAAPAAKDPKRKICEAVEETGSRLSSKRICMTAEQWEAQNRDTRTAGKRVEKTGGERGGD